MMRIAILLALCTVAASAAKPKPRIKLTSRHTKDWYIIDLDGSGSIGSGITSYTWTRLRPKGDDEYKVLDGESWEYKTTEPGTYRWKLTVCNADGCRTKRQSIDVEPSDALNHPPLIGAQMHWSTTGTRHAMHIDASASRDDDQGIKSYTWEMVEGIDPDADRKQTGKILDFVTSYAGTYVWKLTVCDTLDACISELFDHTFDHIAPPQPPNQPPLISARMELSTTGTRHEMHIDARDSSDAQGIESFTYELIKGNDPDAVKKQSDGIGILDFVTSVAGEYVWKLTVTDELGASSTEEFRHTFDHVPPLARIRYY